MNPSAKGWIKKLLIDYQLNDKKVDSVSIHEFYRDLKSCGFIYGTNFRSLFDKVNVSDLTHEEICKVNLVLSLLFIHKQHRSGNDFLESVIKFYETVDNHKRSFFEELFHFQKKSFDLLESMIHRRVAIDDNVITKNFNYFITNTLLFVDVLAYDKFITTGTITDLHLRNLEAAIETIIFAALDLKKEKTRYDESLIRLFESSFRYENRIRLRYHDILRYIENPLTKYYMVDLVCMTFWSDKVIDRQERNFLDQLGKDLNISAKEISKSTDDIYLFYATHKKDIALLKSQNMMQSFYENSSNMVKKLINRNSKRLIKELQESKELMVLLTQSTLRPLTEAEQKQVKDQLLYIFKTIPSLAIFMLPGGMLLLPFVIKYIPNILPSGFDDNRVNK